MSAEIPANLPELAKYRESLRGHIEKISARYRAKFDESDIIQETLTEAHLHADSFRGSSEAELLNWLKRILVRNLIDAIRKLRSQKRNVHAELRMAATADGSRSGRSFALMSQATSPSRRLAMSEELHRMHAALALLPAAQREAISLHHLQGMSLTEVAKTMNRTPGAVAGLLHRGLRALQQNIIHQS